MHSPAPGFQQPNLHGMHTVTHHPVLCLHVDMGYAGSSNVINTTATLPIASWNILHTRATLLLEHHPEHELLDACGQFPGQDFSHSPVNSPFSPNRISHDVLDKLIRVYKHDDLYRDALVSVPTQDRTLMRTPCHVIKKCAHFRKSSIS